MKKKLEQSFSRISPPEPSGDLMERIMAGISKEKKMMAIKRKIAVFSICSFASIAALIPVLSTAKNDIARSGLAEMLSLAFSDPAVIAGAWNQFAFSVLESLPAISISLALMAILVFAASIRYLAKNFRMAYLGPQLKYI